MKIILFLIILFSITLTSCIRGDKYSRKKYYDHTSRHYKYHKETYSDKENYANRNNEKRSSYSSNDEEEHSGHDNKSKKKAPVNYENEEEVRTYKKYHHKRYGH